MLIENLKQKQKKLTDFYTSRGLHVYFREPLLNDEIDVEKVISNVESKLPKHLTSEVEMVIFGQFDEFAERNINAAYKDGALYISNFQDDEADLYDIIKGARLIEQMEKTEAIKSLLLEKPNTSLSSMNDNEIIDDFKERASTIYHPSCTCRMGNDPKSSVVDKNLLVHGINGLRVVDASIFPNITSANTNAPTIMVAHKASEMINSRFN